MRCSSCHAENAADAKFCDDCGQTLELKCPSCGQPNRSTAKFCRNCGGRLAAAAAEQPSLNGTTKAAALPDRMLASRHLIEGERKRVTVLFADIRGSTRFIEKLDPEEVRKHFDPVLQLMMGAVHRYDGTVNQVLGDGIMALFGAPLAHEDHAVRACYAALAMQEEMRRFEGRANGAPGGSLRIGIGINSGEVVVRSLTNDLNIDYSALGQTTHLAARMEALAGPGAIVISADTLREAEGFVEVKSLGALPFKGFSNAIEAFELTGATAARNRLQAGASRGLSPFVGRQAEIDLIRRVVEQVHSGQSQILAMVGDAGVGKSRLLQEFLNRHVPADWRVLEAPSVSYGKASLYLPVIQLLREYFALGETDGADVVGEKIAVQVARLDPALNDAIPALLTVLDALPNGENGQTDGDTEQGLAASVEVRSALVKYSRMEPRERRRYTLSALTRLLLSESRRQPLLLVFEDLHWIDSETQGFLDTLVENLGRGRIFLLVNYRPGYSHTWANKNYYTRLSLNPLPPTGSQELLDWLLGEHRDLDSLKRLLIERTDGNPFFVEESVRSLAEAGALLGAKGDYRPALRLDTIRTPGSVQAVLADRIDRLARAEKQLLQCAAVIGVKVPLAVLREVAEIGEEELFSCLAKLKTAEFLDESNLFPEVEYRFKHALPAEVVYSALLNERRTFLHARVVGALEKIAGANLNDSIDALADHAYRGQLWDRAARYARAAGRKALSRFGFREAIRCFEQALEALGRLPQGQNELTGAIDLRLDLRNALFLIGDFAAALKHLDEALSCAEVVGDTMRLGQIYNFMTAHWNLTGESDRAIAVGERALSVTAAPEHAGLHIVANYYLGVACYNTADFRRARDMLRHTALLIGARRLERFGTTGIVAAIGATWLARSLAQLGELSEALTVATDAVQLGEEGKDPYSLSYGLYSQGMVLLLAGELERAAAPLERALALCRGASILVQIPLIASCLGFVYALSNRRGEALELLEQAVESGASMQRLGGQAQRMAWLSETYLLAGRAAEALSLAQQALALAQQTRDRGSEAWIVRLLGRIESERSIPDYIQAEALYRQALHLADELGMRPLAAHCLFGLAEISGRAGRVDEAKSHGLSAVELYGGLGMTYWLAQGKESLERLDRNFA